MQWAPLPSSRTFSSPQMETPYPLSSHSQLPTSWFLATSNLLPKTKDFCKVLKIRDLTFQATDSILIQKNELCWSTAHSLTHNFMLLFTTPASVLNIFGCILPHFFSLHAHTYSHIFDSFSYSLWIWGYTEHIPLQLAVFEHTLWISLQIGANSFDWVTL